MAQPDTLDQHKREHCQQSVVSTLASVAGATRHPGSMNVIGSNLSRFTDTLNTSKRLS